MASEAAVRELLSDFLPERFGVASGFIIPDLGMQSVIDTLTHDDLLRTFSLTTTPATTLTYPPFPTSGRDISG